MKSCVLQDFSFSILLNHMHNAQIFIRVLIYFVYVYIIFSNTSCNIKLIWR